METLLIESIETGSKLVEYSQTRPELKFLYDSQSAMVVDHKRELEETQAKIKAIMDHISKTRL